MSSLLGLTEPWGYVVVGLLAAAEAAAFVGLVVPGEAAMLLGGLLAFQGHGSLWVMISAGIAGAILGDSIGYEIGRRLGPRLRSGRLGSKIGEERWNRAAEYLKTRGGKAIVFGRFVGVLRALVPAAAGSLGVPYRTFLAYNVAGGVLWAGGFIVLGFVTGGSWRIVERWAGRASLVLVVLVVIGGAIAAAAWWLRRNWGGVEARWRSLLARPGVAAFGRRFRPQIEFLGRRLDARSVAGLRLTVALVVALAAGWGFGVVLEDVLADEELAVIDGPVARFMAGHRSPALTDAVRVLSWLGDERVVAASLGIMAAVAWARGRRVPAAVIAISAAGLIVPPIVSALVARAGPPNAFGDRAAASFPGSGTVAATLAAFAVGFLLSHSTSVARRIYAYGAAVFAAATAAVAHLYLGEEWATDALAGLAFGASWFALSWAIGVQAVTARSRRTAPA